MAFDNRFTGEGLVIEVTPTGGSLITVSDDFTSFAWSQKFNNVNVTAGNEEAESSLPTTKSMTWSLDIYGGDDDMLEDLLSARTGLMAVYRHGQGSGLEYFDFNYVLDGFDPTLKNDGAEEITITGTRSGDMVHDFNSVQGTIRHLVFTTQPTDTASGDKIASVVVSIEDASNAVVTSEQSDVITLSKTSDGDSVLTGVLSVRVINGVASFPGVVATGADTGNKIHAASAKGYTAADSSTYTVS